MEGGKSEGEWYQTVCDKVACTDRIKHVSSDKCLDIRSSVGFENKTNRKGRVLVSPERWLMVNVE